MNKLNFAIGTALVLYVPLVVVSFRVLGGRRGMLVSLLGGWMFLPWFNQLGHSIPVVHSKEMFVPTVVLAVSLAFDWPAWRRFQWRPVDIPVAVICLAPFASSLTNGLGPYDGVAAVVNSAMIWGAPYLFGRVYLRTPAELRDGARFLVLAGLAYVPFCLWEIRMSPQLHRQIYGFHQHSFVQHVRDGHYRPMLFMAHGLMVAMFMGSAAVVSYWLWRSRRAGTRDPASSPWTVVTLVGATLLCRSVGAAVLMVSGMAMLELTRRRGAALLIVALALTPATYCTLRITDWDYEPFLARSEQLFGERRAQSLRSRLVYDQELKDHDMQRPWLGWGKWSGSRLRDEEGKDFTVVDSMWILTLGTGGLVALVSTGVLLALPLLLLLRVFAAKKWNHPGVAPAAAAAVVVGIWAIDDLFNAMMSPVFPMLAGAVVSFALLADGIRRQAPRAHPARQPVPSRDPRHVGAR